MAKILVLCEYPSINGGERSFLSVLPGLVEAGFELCVAAPLSGPFADELCASDVKTVPFSAVGENGTRHNHSEIRRRLNKIVASCRPDLIHANSLSMSRLSGPVAKVASVLSIGHLRDIVRVSRKAISDLNCHTRLLAVSEATRVWHVDAGLDDAKIFVLNNGVDLELFQPRPATGYLNSELGLNTNLSLVASIGQIGLRKGLDRTLEAARSIADQVPDAHFLM